MVITERICCRANLKEAQKSTFYLCSTIIRPDAAISQLSIARFVSFSHEFSLARISSIRGTESALESSAGAATTRRMKRKQRTEREREATGLDSGRKAQRQKASKGSFAPALAPETASMPVAQQCRSDCSFRV